MKIIVVGGGIAGLSTYLHLRKHLPDPNTHEITIYESHKPYSTPSTIPSQYELNQSVNLDVLSESTTIVGGGLGIAPNGMRVLRDLDLELYDKVITQGYPAENFIFKGANGWTLGMQSTSDAAVRAKGLKEVCVASSRHGLWHTLRQHVIGKYGKAAIEYRKVLKVVRDKDKSDRAALRVLVYTIDEQGRRGVSRADLVIGADGVKSVVRRALFGQDERYSPVYSGQSGVGGFLRTPIPPVIAENKAMVFDFGGNGFFGYSSSGPLSRNQLMWWSTFETSSLLDTKNIDPLIIQLALFDRHKRWNDPVIQHIIRNAQFESIYPTWTLPTLPHWGETGMVLLGDAAHAMDPAAGQGASQALEDSQTFALLLTEMLDIERHGCAPYTYNIDKAIHYFHQIRAPRINKIVERGKKLAGKKADVGIVKEYAMYCFLWLVLKFPLVGKILIGDTQRELYCWSAREEIRMHVATPESDTTFVQAGERSRLLG